MLRIRPYEPADEADVVALWRDSGLLANPLNDPNVDLAFARTSGHAEVLVGVEEDRLVAAAMVGHDGHRGWLYYIATDPARRRAGLGRRIVGACEAWLKERGVPKVQLIVRASNTRIIGFYQRLGYMVEPREILSKRLDGRVLAAGGAADGSQPVTITYLAMDARPALPRIEPRGSTRLALLRAHAPTVGFYRYLYDAVGRAWFWTDRKMLGDDELVAIVQDRQVEIYVLYAEGVPAGFFELDRRPAGSIDLAYFGIVPEFIGRALGPYLLREALEIAWSYGPSRVTVNTCTLDHPKALTLYQRFGFIPYAQRTVPGPWARGQEAESDD